MTRLPQIAMLADGRRLHLQDGPIDLIVEARGSGANLRAAYDAAARRFTGLLDTLCEELVELRKPANPFTCVLQGKVARRMNAAVAPYAADHFITPMAAVAGAVAEEILGAMVNAASLDRAYVNNGGDIALHLGESQRFTVGLVDRPDQPGLMQTTIIGADDPARGIATSGRHGRSFSLGIADAVTVLARTAAQADAAATIIANAVDLPDILPSFVVRQVTFNPTPTLAHALSRETSVPWTHSRLHRRLKPVPTKRVRCSLGD